MTRKQLIELARELHGTDDDLETALRSLGLDTEVVGRSANYDDYLENLAFLRKVRHALRRFIYQCPETGYWRSCPKS